MKAMKAMKKKKKAMKKYKAQTLKRMAFAGKIMKTKSGLSKADLVKSKSGKIVSKKKSAKGKTNPWIAAVNAARKALGTKGFAKIKKGSPLYAKAKSLYTPPMKAMKVKLAEEPTNYSVPLMALCALFVGAGLVFVNLRSRRSASKPLSEPFVA